MPASPDRRRATLAGVAALIALVLLLNVVPRLAGLDLSAIDLPDLGLGLGDLPTPLKVVVAVVKFLLVGALIAGAVGAAKRRRGPR